MAFPYLIFFTNITKTSTNMQVFVPYPEPIKVAQCLDKKRLNKQIIECRQIIAAIDGRKAWNHHPCTLMYRNDKRWLELYLHVLCHMQNIKSAKNPSEDMRLAYHISEMADFYRPSFLTEEFCNQHKRRLYTKNPEFYKQFAEYGKSEENWYFVDGELRKYINGKRIE